MCVFISAYFSYRQTEEALFLVSVRESADSCGWLTLARGNFVILWQILSKFVIPETAHAVWIKRAELNEQSTRATIHHCLSYKYLEIHFSAYDLSIRIQHIEFYFLKKIACDIDMVVDVIFFLICFFCFVLFCFFFHSPYFFIIVLSIIVVSFFFLSLIDWSQNRERIRSKSPFSIS